LTRCGSRSATKGWFRNKAVHIALGVRADGAKEILGLWLEQNEGAKFWLRVMNELKNRGIEDVLIGDCQEFRAEVGHDGSKGAHGCRDAKSLLFLTPLSTSFWLAPTRRQSSTPMACSTD
jgi:hypothetical protein